MAPKIIKNSHRSWSGERSDEGHRTYKVSHRIKAAPHEGPSSILNNTPDLPKPGDAWLFDDDNDEWCFCTWAATVTPVVPDQTNEYWDIEQTFTSNPKSRCNDNYIQNPLMEPMKVSGGFSKTTEEAVRDRFDMPIMNSAWEQLRGPQVEFDDSRPTIKIEQNVASLNVPLLMSMKDCVNDAPLWGISRRCLKLTNITWERKYYGQCLVYYTRTFEFEANPHTWDRDLMDEGTKVLNGHWNVDGSWTLDNIAGFPPRPSNPKHFIRCKDRNNENIRIVLNGHGLPGGIVTSTVALFICIQTDTIGMGVDNTEFWLPLVNEEIGIWNEDQVFTPLGLVVIRNLVDGDAYFLSIKEIKRVNLTPGAAVPPEEDDINWMELVEPPPVDRGEWGAGVTYQIGDFVREGGEGTTGVGNIHVEKYNEANFLLLGIPEVL